MTDEEFEQFEDALRPRLTDEFLATLVEAAKVDGNGSDWIETQNFVRNTFHLAGKEPPEMESYDMRENPELQQLRRASPEGDHSPTFVGGLD